jgi:hypothetical protein
VLPPEIALLPSLNDDGTLVVNDGGAVPLFHTIAVGEWAVEPADALQIAGRVRYGGSVLWLHGSPDPVAGPEGARRFVGAARPRFAWFWDANDPDAMQGFMQVYFFPIAGTGERLSVPPVILTGPFDGNHQSGLNLLGPLPEGCQTAQGCLGTYHFTIHRIKPA